MEYKKKYNSKKQTIEEENKIISENNLINQQNNYNSLFTKIYKNFWKLIMKQILILIMNIKKMI